MQEESMEELWKISRQKQYTWQELVEYCVLVTGLPVEVFERYYRQIIGKRGGSGRLYKEADVIESDTVFMVLGICLDLSHNKGLIKPCNVMFKTKEWSNYRDYFKGKEDDKIQSMGLS